MGYEPGETCGILGQVLPGVQGEDKGSPPAVLARRAGRLPSQVSDSPGMPPDTALYLETWYGEWERSGLCSAPGAFWEMVLHVAPSARCGGP
jgi:hypothetical protein